MQPRLLILLSAFAALVPLCGRTQPSDERMIRQKMAEQVEAWNRGSIDDFMKLYWHDDSLVFVGQAGLSFGYDQVLKGYHERYSDRQKMGILFFTLLRLKRLGPDFYLVLGKWFLKRSIGDVGGYYSLVFRKIRGEWQIICDHTS
jgi:ketosteroid isomerase-like protein